MLFVLHSLSKFHLPFRSSMQVIKCNPSTSISPFFYRLFSALLVLVFVHDLTNASSNSCNNKVQRQFHHTNVASVTPRPALVHRFLSFRSSGALYTVLYALYLYRTRRTFFPLYIRITALLYWLLLYIPIYISTPVHSRPILSAHTLEPLHPSSLQRVSGIDTVL